MRTVREVFNRAVDGLAVQPEGEVAEVMRADLALLTDTLQARCAELPRLLETIREPGKLHEWTV